MTSRTNAITNQNRKLVWDEEDRLDHIEENGTTFRYTYDAGGARIIKQFGPMGRVALNGLQQNTITKSKVNRNESQNDDLKNKPPCLEEYTVYVNPFIVVRNGIITKHLFVEGQRISSKLSESLNGDGMGFDELDDAPTYYYHPNHLGSTSYVTDNAGELNQHFEYLPFGEVFVEHQNDNYQTPYLFNGKELDQETGLYYYGARYYDPVLTSWLSVDPLVEKYLDWSPYNYVKLNPVKNADPDGSDIIIVGLNGRRYIIPTADDDDIYAFVPWKILENYPFKFKTVDLGLSNFNTNNIIFGHSIGVSSEASAVYGLKGAALFTYVNFPKKSKYGNYTHVYGELEGQFTTGVQGGYGVGLAFNFFAAASKNVNDMTPCSFTGWNDTYGLSIDIKTPVGGAGIGLYGFKSQSGDWAGGGLGLSIGGGAKVKGAGHRGWSYAELLSSEKETSKRSWYDRGLNMLNHNTRTAQAVGQYLPTLGKGGQCKCNN